MKNPEQAKPHRTQQQRNIILGVILIAIAVLAVIAAIIVPICVNAVTSANYDRDVANVRASLALMTAQQVAEHPGEPIEVDIPQLAQEAGVEANALSWSQENSELLYHDTVIPVQTNIGMRMAGAGS